MDDRWGFAPLGSARAPEWLVSWVVGKPAPDPIDDEWLRWWFKRHYLDSDSTVGSLLARAAKEPLLPDGLRLWLVFQPPYLTALATQRGEVCGRRRLRTEVKGPSFKLSVELRGFQGLWLAPECVMDGPNKLVIEDDW
jgi:hypothetical protein